jgi:hypothetical protein
MRGTMERADDPVFLVCSGGVGGYVATLIELRNIPLRSAWSPRNKVVRQVFADRIV